MNITITGGLPYVQVSLFHQGRSLDLHSVILDTGSAGSVLLQAGAVIDLQKLAVRAASSS